MVQSVQIRSDLIDHPKNIVDRRQFAIGELTNRHFEIIKRDSRQREQ